MSREAGHSGRRGFTIWELLCVIALIVLLVALLVPSLSRTRMLAGRMVCGTYLSGYGRAANVYLAENNELFPGAWLYTDESDSLEHPIGCRWHDAEMAPSSKMMITHPEYQGQMWYDICEFVRPCPIFRQFSKARVCENPAHNDRIDVVAQYNYTMNAYLGSAEEGGVMRLEQVRNPGMVFLFAEENCWSVQAGRGKDKWLSAALSTSGLDDTRLLIRPTPEAENCFGTYHDAPSRDLNRGHGNAVFVDGHVELIRAEDQLRKNMHGGESRFGPGGNLTWAWASTSEPPGGWEGQ